VDPLVPEVPVDPLVPDVPAVPEVPEVPDAVYDIKIRSSCAKFTTAGVDPR
jgi:hypothetical protein